jgi:hypothetical protein
VCSALCWHCCVGQFALRRSALKSVTHNSKRVSLLSKYSPSGAYITNRISTIQLRKGVHVAYKVPPNIFSFVKAITANLSRTEYRFLCHLLIPTIRGYRALYSRPKKKDNGWIPLKRHFIDAKFRHADPLNLKAARLIEIDRHYVVGSKPRRYRIQRWVIEDFVFRILEQSFGEDFNLISKKLWNRDKKVALTVRDCDPLPLGTPPLIPHALSKIPVSYYDRPSVLAHLQKRFKDFQQTHTVEALERLLHDAFCWHVIQQTTLEGSGDIACYEPHYSLQKTGRVTTAMQSASREMKQAAYGSIGNVFNYDLSSSQVYICYEGMKKHGIACSWFEEYLADKTKRAAFAEQVSVEEDVWKECFISLIMGGYLPPHTKSRYAKGLPVLENLGQGKVSEELLAERLEAFKKTVHPLMKPLRQWHKLLQAQLIQDGQARNAIGIVRSIDDFDLKRTGQFVAHILQGAEAYFIHTLTTLSEEYGFIALGNEHDGLITLGEIPDSAIQKTKELTAMPYLELRIKPFL